MKYGGDKANHGDDEDSAEKKFCGDTKHYSVGLDSNLFLLANAVKVHVNEMRAGD